MKCLVVGFALVVLVSARPDVSHLPSGSYLPTGGHLTGYETSGSHISGISGGISGIGGIVTGGIGTGGIGIGGVGGYQQDQKHVYFYAAPDEEQLSRFRINIAPSSQRNTKIIFVKAPSYGGIVPEVIAPPSISEDKTLVYVLVKKQDHGGQINIPAGAGVKQTKPEVYFIKYKSQQDAQAAISGGLQGQIVGSSVSEVGSESSFVRTLDSGSHTHGGGSLGGGIQISGSHSTGSIGVVTGGGGTYGPAGASGPY